MGIPLGMAIAVGLYGCVKGVTPNGSTPQVKIEPNNIHPSGTNPTVEPHLKTSSSFFKSNALRELTLRNEFLQRNVAAAPSTKVRALLTPPPFHAQSLTGSFNAHVDPRIENLFQNPYALHQLG